jgi:hypothetical protein
VAPPEPPDEEPTPAPSFAGHIEAAYHRSFGDSDGQQPVPLRSYDAAGGNSFLFHTAHLAVSHSFSDAVTLVIEFDGGHDAGVNNAGIGITAGADGIWPMWFDVQEAYATYKTPFGLSITAGKFVTYEGIEVIEGPVNPTMTRGFLFGLAEAFTHVGAKVHYAVGDVADIGVGLVNGWDVFVDNNDAKTVIWRLGVTPVDMFGVGFSGSWGAERTDSDDDARLSLDLTGFVKAVPDILTINFQVNYGSEPNGLAITDAMGNVTGREDATWIGFGIQPVVNVDAFSAGLRVEYFSDPDGARAALGEDMSFWNFTITPGYTLAEGFTARAEYRLDMASEDVFYDGESTNSTIALGAHYMF